MTNAVRPTGPTTSIAPWLSVADATAAVEYYKAAFGTEVAAIHEAHGWRVGRLVDTSGHHWEVGKRIP